MSSHDNWIRAKDDSAGDGKECPFVMCYKYGTGMHGRPLCEDKAAGGLCSFAVSRLAEIEEEKAERRRLWGMDNTKED